MEKKSLTSFTLTKSKGFKLPWAMSQWDHHSKHTHAIVRKPTDCWRWRQGAHDHRCSPRASGCGHASNAVVMASHSSILDRNNDYTKFLKSRWMVSRRAQWKRRKMSEGKRAAAMKQKRERNGNERGTFFLRWWCFFFIKLVDDFCNWTSCNDCRFTWHLTATLLTDGQKDNIKKLSSIKD